MPLMWTHIRRSASEEMTARRHTRLRRPWLAAAMAMASLLVARASGRPQVPSRPPGADGASFTMALAGDSLITRKLSVVHDPAFLKVVDLVGGADAAFTNLEML